MVSLRNGQVNMKYVVGFERKPGSTWPCGHPQCHIGFPIIFHWSNIISSLDSRFTFGGLSGWLVPVEHDQDPFWLTVLLLGLSGWLVPVEHDQDPFWSDCFAPWFKWLARSCRT